MATSAVVTARLASSDTRAHIITVTGPASYVAGGEALTAASLGFGNAVTNIQSAITTTGLLAVWNTSTSKLQFFYPTGGGATAPASIADPIVTSGASTASAVSATTPTITPGRGKEVSQATDLSGTVVVMLACGI